MTPPWLDDSLALLHGQTSVLMAPTAQLLSLGKKVGWAVAVILMGPAWPGDRRPYQVLEAEPKGIAHKDRDKLWGPQKQLRVSVTLLS